MRNLVYHETYSCIDATKTCSIQLFQAGDSYVSAVSLGSADERFEKEFRLEKDALVWAFKLVGEFRLGGNSDGKRF